MLGVDRDDLPRLGERLDQRAADDQRLLVGERQRAARLQGGEGGREADRAGDAVQHGVAVGGGELGGRLGARRGSRAAARAGPYCGGQRLAQRRGTASSRATATVRTPQPARPARRAGATRPPAADSAGHPEAVRVAQHDVDGLGADRAGGAEDHDVAWGRPPGRRGRRARVRVGEGGWTVAHAPIVAATGSAATDRASPWGNARRPGRLRNRRCRRAQLIGPVDVLRSLRAGGGVGDPRAVPGRVDDALPPATRRRPPSTPLTTVRSGSSVLCPQPARTARRRAAGPAGRTRRRAGRPRGRGSPRRRAASRRARRPRSSRTARRRCRRSGRGSPAWSPSGPASGTCRRRCSGPACARPARRTAGGAASGAELARTTSGSCPGPATSLRQPLGVEAAGLARRPCALSLQRRRPGR